MCKNNDTCFKTPDNYPYWNVQRGTFLPVPVPVRKENQKDNIWLSLTVSCNNTILSRSKRWTHTVSNATSNLWWFVVTKTFKDIYELASPATPFLVYGCVCVFGFFFILIFLPETRHGKQKCGLQ